MHGRGHAQLKGNLAGEVCVLGAYQSVWMGMCNVCWWDANMCIKKGIYWCVFKCLDGHVHCMRVLMVQM